MLAQNPGFSLQHRRNWIWWFMSEISALGSGDRRIRSLRTSLGYTEFQAILAYMRVILIIVGLER